MYVLIFRKVDTASGMVAFGPFDTAEEASVVAKTVYAVVKKPWIVLPVLDLSSAPRFLTPAH